MKNLWLYVLVIFALYFGYAHYKVTLDSLALKNEEIEFTEKIEVEKDKKLTLDKIDEKATTQKAIESMARSDLNYLKDGEILFVDGDKAKQ